MRLAAILTSLLVIAVAGESQAQAAPAPPAEHPTVELSPELDRVLRDYESAWRRGDAAGLAALSSIVASISSVHSKPQSGSIIVPSRAGHAELQALARRAPAIC